MYNGYNISAYNAHFIPNTVHGESTLSQMYFTYLFNKVMGLFEWDIPKEWNKNFFVPCLLIDGYLSIAEYGEYGVIPLNCTLSGYNVFYQPKKTIVTNPCLKSPQERTIDKDCVLLYFKPNYMGICDIVSLYADMMALAVETQSTNLVNSKLAYVFACKNKTTAESFKKMFDNIQKGDPAVFMDRGLFDKEGNPMWSTFANNLSQNFIAPEISELLQAIESRFDGEFGLGNAGLVEKKERLITDEVNKDTDSRRVRIDLWVDTMNECFSKVRELFGIDCSVKLKIKDEEVSEDVTTVSNNSRIL